MRGECLGRERMRELMAAHRNDRRRARARPCPRTPPWLQRVSALITWARVSVWTAPPRALTKRAAASGKNADRSVAFRMKSLSSPRPANAARSTFAKTWADACDAGVLSAARFSGSHKRRATRGGNGARSLRHGLAGRADEAAALDGAEPAQVGDSLAEGETFRGEQSDQHPEPTGRAACLQGRARRVESGANGTIARGRRSNVAPGLTCTCASRSSVRP